MATLSSNTHANMEALQTKLLQQASPTRKMEILAQFFAAPRMLALTGLRAQYPRASEAELCRRLANLPLREEVAQGVRRHC